MIFSVKSPAARRLALFVCGVLLMFDHAASAGPLPKYADDVALLRKHTDVIELHSADEPGVVAVCPKWQGRVMTSTFGVDYGPSLGWVNRPFIEAGKPDKVFNNYGGAERFWLSPEAGQFALFFEQGKPQELKNWYTPVEMNETAFSAERGNDATVMLKAGMRLTNYAGSKLDLEIKREIQYAGRERFKRCFGEAALDLLRDGGGQLVGFTSHNTVTNRGTALTKAGGLISIWTLGQFQPGPENVIVVPHRTGPASQLGEVVTTRYFGEIPPERLRPLGNALLFRGDGQYRSKIGVSSLRTKSLAAAMNFESEVLTVVSFDGPRDPHADVYLNNLWDLPQKEPYKGDAVNSYNDGPTSPGEASLGGFFELETLSAARELKTGEGLQHVNTTFHIKANFAVLDQLAKEILGVSLDQMRAFLQE